MTSWPKTDNLKILVIEDDAFSRMFISGALTNAGLNVIAAVEQTIAKIAKALEIPAATNQNQRVHIARVFFRLTGQGNL
jgi:CheY-like chemotaxis protein